MQLGRIALHADVARPCARSRCRARAAPTRSRKVVRGLIAETIVRARISSPFSSTTPTARPFSTMILPPARSCGWSRRPFPRPRRSPRRPRPCRRSARSARRARRRFRRPAGSRGRAARSASAGRDGCRASRRRRAGPSAGRPSSCSSSTSATFIRSMRRKSRMSSLPSRFSASAGHGRAPSVSASDMPSRSGGRRGRNGFRMPA